MSQYDDAYMYEATFEAQYMKKLGNTEAELKKSIAYSEKTVSLYNAPLLQPLNWRCTSRCFSLKYNHVIKAINFFLSKTFRLVLSKVRFLCFFIGK